MSLHTTRPLRSAVLLGVVALAGCGTGSLTIGIGGSGDAAIVRFVNATGSALDLAQDGVVSTANANIAPGLGVGCFTLADPTTPLLSVRTAGTTVDLSGFPLSFASGGRFTVVAYPGPSGIPQFISIPATFVPVAGRSGLRVFNGSSALSAVDVFATVPGAALSVPIISSLNFGVASSTIDLAAGSTQVRLTTTGTFNVVFDAGTLVLAAGKAYTLVVSSAGSAPILVPDC